MHKNASETLVRVANMTKIRKSKHSTARHSTARPVVTIGHYDLIIVNIFRKMGHKTYLSDLMLELHFERFNAGTAAKKKSL